MENRQQIRIEAYFDVCREKFGKDGRAWCFVAAMSKASGDQPFQLGVAEYGVGGYTPLNLFFDSYEETSLTADDLNKKLGLSVNQACQIHSDTMRRPASMIGHIGSFA